MQTKLPIKIFILISIIFIGIFFMALLGQKSDHSLENLNLSDSLLIEAKNKAKMNMPVFDSLYRQHPQKAFLRFKYLNAKNQHEHIWGRVNEKNQFAYVLTSLNENDNNSKSEYPLFYDLTPDKIEDWIIEYQPDKYWGGYTTQVILMRKMQKYPEQKAKIERELKKFADAL